MKNKINPRRPFFNDLPDGPVESDMDFLRNNIDAAVELLEMYQSVVYRKRINKRIRRWVLPNVLQFGDLIISSYYFYRVVDFRPPLKGEWFVSGANPQAYLAHSDMSESYLIVEMTCKAKLIQIWEKDEK